MINNITITKSFNCILYMYVQYTYVCTLVYMYVYVRTYTCTYVRIHVWINLLQIYIEHNYICL